VSLKKKKFSSNGEHPLWKTPEIAGKTGFPGIPGKFSSLMYSKINKICNKKKNMNMKHEQTKEFSSNLQLSVTIQNEEGFVTLTVYCVLLRNISSAVTHI
jgi:hypothetical protein